MSDSPAPTPPPAPYKYRGPGTCACDRCRMQGLGWPVILIAVGAIFLLGQFIPGLGIRQLWPVILIVIGVMQLLEHTASIEGHRG